MIHGFTGDHHGFQKLIPLLKNNYFIITPDLPGSGMSALQPETQWNINALAKLANEFVAALQLPKKPIIFGHSMGGLVVASMISQYPSLFAQKAVLLSPVPAKIKFLDSRWLGAILSDTQYFIGHTAPYIGPRLIKSKWLTKRIANLLITTDDKAIIQFTKQQMLNNLNYISSIKYYACLSKDINRRGAIDYADALSKKDLLIISGDSDRVVPLPKLKQLVVASKAHLVLIEGVGHDIHYEQAPQAAQAMTNFLAKSK